MRTIMLSWLCLSPALGQDMDIQEELRVLQYVTAVRALDARGAPLRELGPEDFALTNHGRPVAVDTVQWVDARAPVPADDMVPGQKATPPPLPDYTRTDTGFIDTAIAPLPDPRAAPAPAPTAPPTARHGYGGRLMILLVQNDIGSSRNQGLVHMIHHGKKMLDDLAPDDWVAVVSFDSHLKLHLDFSRDRAAAHDALERCLTKVPGRILIDVSPPSLADGLDPDAAEDAADMETAMTLLAGAVDTLPGEKILAYIGWGFGLLDESGVKTTARYDVMLQALTAADVTVFSLDMTMADYHSLERTLMRLARETGGIYERTANHPAQSLQRFLSAVEGYYLISYTLPVDGPAPDLKLEIKGRRKARVAFHGPAPGPPPSRLKTGARR